MTRNTHTFHNFSNDMSDMSGNCKQSLSHDDSRVAGLADRPLIAHVVNRFDVGGLETVMAELINATGEDIFRHVIICLTGYSEFRQRIGIAGVDVHTLHKRPGKDVAVYRRLWQLFRRLRPDLVQTYNIGTIDAAIPARLAGIRVIVHAEHGRSADDPMGRNARYNLVRRLLNPLIAHYIVVSDDLNRWLVKLVKLPTGKITRIYNGVHVPRYSLDGIMESQRRASLPAGFTTPESTVFMNVGRLDPVKDQAGLIRAFVHAVNHLGSVGEALRLVIVGDGSEAEVLKGLVQASGVSSQILMTGSRADIPCLLAAADVFVSSSIAEGIAMTILEAMACARAVIATAVGGNPEVVVDGKTGILVPSGAPQELAAAMCQYVGNRDLALRHGAAGRARVAEHFGHEEMVSSYVELYGALIRTTSSQGRDV